MIKQENRIERKYEHGRWRWNFIPAVTPKRERERKGEERPDRIRILSDHDDYVSGEHSPRIVYIENFYVNSGLTTQEIRAKVLAITSLSSGERSHILEHIALRH